MPETNFYLREAYSGIGESVVKKVRRYVVSLWLHNQVRLGPVKVEAVLFE